MTGSFGHKFQAKVENSHNGCKNRAELKYTTLHKNGFLSVRTKISIEKWGRYGDCPDGH
jgi:hypothetical protein